MEGRLRIKEGRGEGCSKSEESEDRSVDKSEAGGGDFYSYTGRESSELSEAE